MSHTNEGHSSHRGAHELNDCAERALLVGLNVGNQAWDLQSSLDELERLAQTAGLEVIGRVT